MTVLKFAAWSCIVVGGTSYSVFECAEYHDLDESIFMREEGKRLRGAK